jgi:hypothetical protein
VTPRSWQVITLGDAQIGLITVALLVIIVGSVLTVIQRLRRIARALP